MKEDEIRKRGVFSKYLELVGKDVKDFFDFNSFVETNCPACRSFDFLFEFEKLGFRYVSCRKCYTLFVNPRPPFEVLKKFYSDSYSTNFWINNFFKPVADVRREKLFKPRAEYISKIIEKDKELVIGDIGAGFGLFPDNHYVAIEPSAEMSDMCIEKGLETKCMCLEDIDISKAGFDLLAAFELTEHLYEPESFFKSAYTLLNPGGWLFLTTLNGQGFDIMLLGDESKSVAPPHHLNLLNPTSIKYLLEGIGFEIVEVSTPGMLDWDIVEGMIKNEGVRQGRFWEMLAKEGSGKCKMELQKWISENSLSSHMRVIARKMIMGNG